MTIFRQGYTIGYSFSGADQYNNNPLVVVVEGRFGRFVCFCLGFLFLLFNFLVVFVCLFVCCFCCCLNLHCSDAFFGFFDH